MGRDVRVIGLTLAIGWLAVFVGWSLAHGHWPPAYMFLAVAVGAVVSVVLRRRGA